ncbi:MAG: Amylo-alpha-1,6-glucosidase [Planctomycetes bacterium ADurb.Bin401]|nr:MAG: Amylo-alpha-1,6-glucosidase [Planctomycetes bacterium ADurb.Bin401]
MAEQTLQLPKANQIHISEYERLISTEWLLSNRRGSFACGTLCGNNTRRYHGLLVGAIDPVKNRTVALSNCQETIITEQGRFNLNYFEFDPPALEKPVVLPSGFKKETGVHFNYTTPQFKMVKSIYLMSDADIVAIEYNFTSVLEKFEFNVRPLAAMRGYHSLVKRQDNFTCEWQEDFLSIKNEKIPNAQILMATDEMSFIEDRQWWHNFFYRIEKKRGFDYTEDLWSPGYYRRTIDGPTRIVLWAGFGDNSLDHRMSGLDVDVIIDDLKLQHKQIISNLKTRDETVQLLALAGEQFIIDKKIEKLKTKSILAGFPWFADWGRDAFISLEGLLLCCGRYEDANSVLLNFAYNADEGMIANFFGDDHTGASYNSIDASLWFIHAAFRYFKASGDNRGFSSRLMPVIRWIIDSYLQGTKFGIKADSDSLITGGSYDTQLTWMDAKFDNVVFTPRNGKAVEVNALWYNAVCNCVDFYKGKDAVLAERFQNLANRIAESFCRCFWYQQGRYLYDCVNGDNKDASVRPNQIFAVSLPYSPLDIEQQKAVVDCVEANLLTSYGLRTLAPGDSKYIGVYRGGPAERDRAYHQGTVWPWLIGAFTEAYLKVNNYSKQSKRIAAERLEPLLDHFANSTCIGSISEVFDGDQPHQPGAAFAQAWSIAEVLRAYLMTHT